MKHIKKINTRKKENKNDESNQEANRTDKPQVKSACLPKRII